MLLGATTMLVSRGIAVITNLLVVTLMARSLTKEAFGLWAVTGSIVLFSTSFDFGLGQGLKNKLAALSAISENNKNEQRDYFLSVFYFLLLIAVIVFLLCIIIIPFIQWNDMLNIHDPKLKNIVIALMITVFGSFMFNLPLSLSSSGFIAYQESHLRALFDIVQSIFLLIIVFVSVHFFSVMGIITSYYAVYVCVALLSTIVFFIRRGWKLILLPLSEQLRKVIPLAKISLQFWLLGLSSIVLLSADLIVVSRVAGLVEAGDYSLLQKMFALLIALHFTVLTPLWTAYTQAAETGDWIWIYRTLKRTVYLTVFLFVVGGFLIIVFHEPILYYWVGRKINYVPLVAAMALKTLIYSWINCYSVLLNSQNNIKIQTTLSVISALLIIPLSLNLGHNWGLIGVAIASIIVLLPVMVSNTIQVKIILKKRYSN